MKIGWSHMCENIKSFKQMYDYEAGHDCRLETCRSYIPIVVTPRRQPREPVKSRQFSLESQQSWEEGPREQTLSGAGPEMGPKGCMAWSGSESTAL